MDWKKFRKILLNSDLSFPEITNTNDINNAVTNFQTLISDVQKQATYQYANHNSSFTLPNYIHNIFMQRNIIPRLFQNSRDPFLKPVINRINNKIKNFFYKERQKNFE